MIKKPQHKSVSKVKKELVPIFSKYIRMRDCIRTLYSLTRGICISCGEPVDLNKADAGHFISRWYANTLFDERNNHLQCKRCNKLGEKVRYRKNIIKYYGEGIDEILDNKSREEKQFSVAELEELKAYYRERIRQFESGNYEIVWRDEIESPDEIKDVGNNADVEDLNLMTPPGRLILGVVIDQQYGGPGVRIQQVQKDSLADKAGLKDGDVITKLDEKDIAGFNELRQVLGAKKHGDKITGEYTRGGETKKFSGQFPEAKSQPAYRRTKTTGSIEAKVNGNMINVRVKNVAKYTLLVDREQFELKEPIVVKTNGEETFNGIVKPDLVFMLKQYARDNDRTMVYCAKIEITVPKKEKKDEPKEEKEEDAEEGK